MSAPRKAAKGEALHSEDDAASLQLAQKLQRDFEREHTRGSSPTPHTQRDVVHVSSDDDEDAVIAAASARPIQQQPRPSHRKKRPLEEETKQPVRASTTKDHGDVHDDAEVAARLQEEELHKARRLRTETPTQSTSASSVRTSAVIAETSIPRHSDTEAEYHDVAFYRNYIRGVNNDFAIRLSDVVQGPINRAVLLNYCWDLDWLLDSLPVLQTVPLVECVAGEKFRGTSALARQSAALACANVRCYHAKLPVPYSCHHTKMMLLFYDTGVRVVVLTANFLACDVYYKNQGVYVQDFPLRATPAAEAASLEANTDNDDGGGGADWLRDDFERTLCEYFTQYQKVGLDIVDLLRRYDYSAAKVVLIPSAPGTFLRDMARWGHMKVRAVLRRELLLERSVQQAPIVAQFSSLGSMHPKWLLELRRSLGSQRLTAFPTATEPPSIRMVWPTVSDVRDSIEGWIAGGSICCDSRNHKDFLRPLYHRWEGRATGRHEAAPHLKSYSRSAQQSAAFVLLTSANMSAAAWGALQKNDSQLAVRHYEMGVLIIPQLIQRRRTAQPAFSCTPDHPVYRHSDQRRPAREATEEARKVQLWLPVMRGAKGAERDRGVNDPPVYRVVCPLPYAVDARPYEANDEPWAWDVNHTEFDHRGHRFLQKDAQSDEEEG